VLWTEPSCFYRGIILCQHLSLPAQDKAIARELDAAMQTPKDARRYVDEHKSGSAFRLWDTNRDGRVSRTDLNTSLLRCIFQFL